jgi:hypothetical protein
LAFLLSLFAAAPVAAKPDDEKKAKREVVTPKHMKGWAFFEEIPVGSGEMVNGPGSPPLGDGSAELRVDNNGREILFKQAYQGTYFRNFTQLTYWTYRQHGLPPYQISLQFEIDRDLTDSDESYQGRLIYEPYYTHVVLTGMWQLWDTQDDAVPGNWWFSRAPQNTPGTGCSIADPCTWTELLTKFPNAGVHRTFGAIFPKAGGPTVGGFIGNVDALTVGILGSRATVYDFELDKKKD